MNRSIKMPKGEKRFSYLRKQYPEFAYKSFNWSISKNDLSFDFKFNCNEIEFNPKSKITFPKHLDLEKTAKSRAKLIDNLVFNIGMIEMVSYWKATCSPKIIVECGKLSSSQISWWIYLYYHGLGEFFYLNKINTSEEKFVQITSTSKIKFDKNTRFKPKKTNLLVPIGGGKDSLASVEILRNTKDKKIYLLMNPTKAALDSAKSATKKLKEESIIIKRVIDKRLLDLNKAGFLNGHTPFSAMLAFYSTLTSVIANTKYTCLSNEASANEPTIIGTDINHQYSKTIEFEKNYNTYLKKFISPNYIYFSLLRPLNEFQIVSIFSKSKKNLSIFKSCNVGSKKDIWCCDCSKCLFVFILLSAHIGLKKTEKVFGKDLLNQKSLKKEFLELIGHAKTKPFECIGTIDEINAAITVVKQNEPEEFSKRSLLSMFNKNYSNSYANKKELKNIQSSFFKGHRLNNKFKTLVYDSYKKANS